MGKASGIPVKFYYVYCYKYTDHGDFFRAWRSELVRTAWIYCDDLVVAILVGSIGVFCSSAFKKTISSIVMTFLIEFGVLFLPLIICGGVLGVEAIAYAAVTDQMMNPPDPNFGPTPFIMILTPLTGFLII